MFGLILWAIVIIIIVICACPGFITFVLTSIMIAFSVYGLILWIVQKIKNRKK